MSENNRVVAEIARMCRDDGRTVAAVESLTSGGVSTALGRGADASDWFRGSIVAYHLTTKQRGHSPRPRPPGGGGRGQHERGAHDAPRTAVTERPDRRLVKGLRRRIRHA
ncbi:CinA family protein [Microbacterium hominis]|uniref:CinA family protein n=1 Tax=Microbacterium hominis TaxID=162426 RepID=A0A7D4UIX8_9MICO|nr:CinA family protein [Microbacterium hominis]QKJ18967.1 CinA family protein [Microbacterium hominis]